MVRQLAKHGSILRAAYEVISHPRLLVFFSLLLLFSATSIPVRCIHWH